jgi:hypothetical protein
VSAAKAVSLAVKEEKGDDELLSMLAGRRGGQQH